MKPLRHKFLDQVTSAVVLTRSQYLLHMKPNLSLDYIRNNFLDTIWGILFPIQTQMAAIFIIRLGIGNPENITAMIRMKVTNLKYTKANVKKFSKSNNITPWVPVAFY